MAARSQKTYYPRANVVCTDCNVIQDPGSCCTSSTAINTIYEDRSCSWYCNSSSSCNTTCNTRQSYTDLLPGGGLISGHADVGPHPSLGCIAQGEFIHETWTAEYWNALADNLATAEQMGSVKQGSTATPGPFSADPCNNTHPSNSLVTAEAYNTIRNKLANFNSSISSVSQGDIITAALAAALKTGYEGAKFNSSVCDICNVSRQNGSGGSCGCNCPCSCDCNCGCDCTCADPDSSP